MKNKLIAFVAVLFLCVACSPKPTDGDIGGVLAENVPKDLKTIATVDQIQADISGAGDDVLVKFKTHLKLNQALFEAADFDAIAKASGSDASLFGEIEKGAKGLTIAGREGLAAAIKAATTKPTFLTEASPTGAAVEWYGSFKAKKVIDKWVSSDFKTDVEPKLKGRPRSEFPESAIESTRASAWFSDIKAEQVALLQKIDTAQQLEKKDAEVAQAQIDNSQMLAQKETQVAQALAVAQEERAAKERVIAQQQELARRMPVRFQFRKALIGGTFILRIEVAQPMTIRLDVTRGLQKFERDLQVAPGRISEIGHLEGWGFKSGDAIMLLNPSFDPVSFATP